jgi:hypothetical protein
MHFPAGNSNHGQDQTDSDSLSQNGTGFIAVLVCKFIEFSRFPIKGKINFFLTQIGIYGLNARLFSQPGLKSSGCFPLAYLDVLVENIVA